MKNYKLLVQYDGTRYDGWQRQKTTENTIQGKLEAVLSLMMDGTKVEIHGSGRTDAGVHALGQVANFHGETSKSVEEIRKYLNKYLPEDIRVMEVTMVSERFHSRLNAVAKTYRYRIIKTDANNVFIRKFAMQAESELNILDMRKAAEHLLGEHDFKGFCTKKKVKKSTVRTIFSIQIKEKREEIQIDICGNGFLYHMVRIIAGTLIEVGMGVRKPDEIKVLLTQKDRAYTGPIAPAKGLTLRNVEY